MDPNETAPNPDIAAGGMNPAARELLPLVYSQLHAAAERLMSGERRDHTLQATALVHEAYERLARDLAANWPGPREFYLAAATAMRKILIDHARRRGSAKRGGDWSRAMLDVAELATDEDCERVVSLDAAVVRLEEEDPRAGEIVRLRFYAGLSVEKTAEVLGLSERTVMRDWEFARAWLLECVREDAEGAA